MNNAELTREFWRVWDEDGLAAILARYDEFFTENAEWRPPISQVSGERYIGREGFERYVADLARLRDGRVHWAWGSYEVAKTETVAAAIARGEKVEV